MIPDLPTWLLAATAFATVMSASPGPNNAMLAASGNSFGFPRSVPHMAGVALGFPVMLLGVTLGLGDLLRAAPFLQHALKWGGVGYLLWLAWRIATARPTPDGMPAAGKPLTFLQASLFQWMNPKAWVIALGAVGTYAAAPAAPAKAVLLTLLFVAVGAASSAFWTLTGVGAARLLRTDRGMRAFNLVMAGLLVLSLIPILTE